METPQLPDTMPDGSCWPRISIVTPSFNQGPFIEETIRSILLQGYPDLEYIIIDGGSDDQTLEIIRKYEPWLAYWVSKRDRGQAHAINEGLRRATGMIFNWVNSDDVLVAGALEAVGRLMGSHDSVAGTVVNFDEHGNEESVPNCNLDPFLLIGDDDNSSVSFHQPGIWLLRDKVLACGGLDEASSYIFDWVLVIRYNLSFPKMHYTNAELARFRLHERSKTSVHRAAFEEERVFAYTKLLQDPKCSKIHATCLRRVRQHKWWLRLRQISESKRSRGLKVAQLLMAALADPSVRLTRLTAGAIKNVVTTAK